MEIKVDIKYIIERELERENRMKREYETMADSLRTGTLSFSEAGVRRYYVLRSEGGHTYLGAREPELVEEIQRRHLADGMLKNLNKNIAALEKARENLKTINPVEVMSGLASVYRNQEVLAEEGGIFADIDAWEYGTFEAYKGHRENLRHRTAKGEMVRSKSEMSIANMLYDRGIPYHYEEILHLNGVAAAPDFTIAVRGENCIKYLEHCGMIADPGYFRSYCRKQYDYISAGLQVGRDVFFTYEDQDGSIDTRIIADLIEMYFR